MAATRPKEVRNIIAEGTTSSRNPGPEQYTQTNAGVNFEAGFLDNNQHQPYRRFQMQRSGRPIQEESMSPRSRHC